MKNIYNAYTEVLVILQNLDYAYYSVPIEIIEKMKRECNLNHKFRLQRELPIQKQKLLDETKAILSVLFRDYWATEEQRKKILAKEKHDLEILEKEKIEKYNPDNLFKNKIEEPVIASNKKMPEINVNSTLTEYKESFFIKFKNFIFKILHIN